MGEMSIMPFPAMVAGTGGNGVLKKVILFYLKIKKLRN